VDFKSLIAQWLTSGTRPGTVYRDVEPESLGLLAARAAFGAPGGAVLVLPALAEAEEVAEGLRQWSAMAGAALAVETLPEIGDVRRYIPENEAKRARTLFSASEPAGKVFVCAALSLLEDVPPLDSFAARRLDLQVGMKIGLDQLAAALVEMDYDDEYQATAPCEFARRGGLLDIFSPAGEHPARVEFWGDQIETIRLYAPETQRAFEKVTSYHVIPRGSPEGKTASGACFLDYLKRPRLLVAFPSRCEDHLERFAPPGFLARWRELMRPGLHKDEICFLDPVESAAADHAVPCGAYQPLAGIEHPLDDELGARATKLHEQLRAAQLRQWLDTGYRVVMLGMTDGAVEHIQTWNKDNAIPAAAVQVEVADLSRGIVLPELKLAVMTEREIFFSPHKRKQAVSHEAARRASPEVETADFAELDLDDYAVHLVYGIGRYQGITELDTDGYRREVMQIEFDENVTVYVPTWQASLVSRYIGSQKSPPSLSKVGGKAWGRTKLAAARSARDMAAEMLRVQALRQGGEGFRFPDDDREQRLFEDAFPFCETADQRRATDELKADMVKEKPMDRLICGDVGYGKTEVAMRGAFKAVMAGKQVAVLVPTTILAQQHYYSFRERFAEYPVNIEMLSRFRSKAEQRETLERAAEAKVDILIGTHRLLQEDIELPNLGMVIIDEEQRFGVVHKEKFKRLRATVDILTMTATPIPRTLYLSMSGVRDMSTIMTAPNQRLPVQTVVCHSEEPLIRNALLREVERGGQTFYLHNRVKTIELRAEQLRALVPEARFAVAHGQMKEDELELVMSKFLDGEVDVLVCTTIIESGLDIPNANTIIIDRADRFGLAELYQLRGRVGRWTRQAYAYLLLPPNNILTGTARERLSAMRRFTQLGAGFRLALKDLEIRGAGNILGANQSGQINAVGFELYCQLLKNEINNLRHSGVSGFLSQVELALDFVDFGYHSREGKLAAGFPPDYITSDRLRVDFYRRCGYATTQGDFDKLEEELSDRFGKLPEPAANFLKIMRCRLNIATLGYHSMSVRERNVFVEGGGKGLYTELGKVPKLKPGTLAGELNDLCVLTCRMAAQGAAAHHHAPPPEHAAQPA